MKPALHRLRGESGAELVEFAILLPILLFLAMLVTEGASMVRTHVILNNAAREGARWAVMPPNTPVDGCNPQGSCAAAGVRSVVKTYASRNNITVLDTEITVNQSYCVCQNNGASCATTSCSTGPRMSFTQVQVAHPYSLFMIPRIPGFGNGSTSSVTLAGTAYFRNFY